MPSSFSWNIGKVQLLFRSWMRLETRFGDGENCTPEQFWKWVNMRKNNKGIGFTDDDLGFTEHGPRAHGHLTEHTGNKNQHFHFELDPKTVFDHEAILGQGQLGSVEKMKIKGSGIVFACKTSTNPHRVQKLRKEANVLQALDHEHIVKFLGTFTPPGRKYYLSLVMSPVGEQNLEEFLRSTKRSEHREWMNCWFFCLASALSYLHNKRIRHEDIKPSNIIHRGDRVLFTDFGSSTEVQSEMTTSTESPAYGSPMYEAPEVLDKSESHGARSDIFSLGCVYVELLTAVAKGHIHELHSFCKEQAAKSKKHSGRFLYSSVVEDLDLWFASLCPPVEITIIWKDIVRLMLLEDRKKRPTAIQTLQLLQAGFIPLVLTNGRNCCNNRGLENVLPEDRHLTLHEGQSLREAHHSIQQVNSVDESLHRLEKLHHLLRVGSSAVNPDKQTLASPTEFVESSFVNIFGSQDSPSASNSLLEIMLHYRFNLNAHGRMFMEPRFLSNTFRPSALSEPLNPVSSMLQAAAWWGDEGSVHTLLNNGADPNNGNEEEGTALHAAVWQGHVLIVKTLLAAGADPNLASVRFSTCLWAAIQQGHDSVVQTLIGAGADINNRFGRDDYPIVIAVEYGRSTVVQTLLDAGADPNYRVNREPFTSLLQKAAYKGHNKVVQNLLKAGADPNAGRGKSKLGTALAIAASLGNSSLIEILYGGGAEVNAIDDSSGTALIAACNRGELESVRMLIGLGADVNLSAGAHGTAHTVASRYKDQEIVHLLEEAGAQRTAETNLAPGTLGNTTILSNDFVITYRANESNDEAAGSAIGYWSPEHSNEDGFPFEQTPWPIKITTK